MQKKTSRLQSWFGVQDMTVGRPMDSLVRFSIPLLVGNLAQQLYNTVDSIVVGQYIGDTALAAVGTAGPILNLLLVLFMGIATGASILSAQYFGAADQAYSWAQPIPDETFDGFAVRLVAPLDEQNPVPSCRNADGPYHEGQYVLTVDGFLVSANVTVEQSNVIDTGFESSDHNPVQMTFRLETGEISSHIG